MIRRKVEKVLQNQPTLYERKNLPEYYKSCKG